MNFENESKETREQRAGIGNGTEEGLGDAQGDARLDEALANFRQSVHAWSDGELSRPRTVAAPARRATWRLATGWALGCALVVGGVSLGIHERYVKVEQDRIAAERNAEHQRDLAAEKAKEDEELFAKVDSDVSREVPAAMEPLAQLMAEDGSQ
jgi:hypothetical protein